MKNQNNLLTTIAIALILTASTAQADTLTARLDTKDGGDPSYTFGLTQTGGISAWAFALPDFPILVIGYCDYFPISKHAGVLATAAVGRYTKLDQWYIAPSGIMFAKMGDFKVKSFWGVYAPLNNGPWRGFCDPTSITYAARSNLDVGLAANAWFNSRGEPTYGFGHIVNVRSGNLGFSARWLAGVNQPNALRMEVSTSF